MRFISNKWDHKRHLTTLNIYYRQEQKKNLTRHTHFDNVKNSYMNIIPSSESQPYVKRSF